MKNFSILIVIISFLLIFVLRASASPFEFKLRCDASEDYFIENNYFNFVSLSFNDNEKYNTVTIKPEIIFSVGYFFSGYLSAEFFWSHFFNSDNLDEAESSYEIDKNNLEAYLNFSFAEIGINIGWLDFQFGKGLIMESVEPGIFIEYKPYTRFYLRIKSCKVMEQSPIVSIDLGYRPGFLEKMEIFGVFFQDEDDSFAELMKLMYPILPFQPDVVVKSHGNLFWYGLNTEIFIGNVYASGIAIIQNGVETLTVSNPPMESRFDLLSYLFDIELDYNITDKFSTGIFLFTTSGDLQIGNRDFNAFISPLPTNLRTRIFFYDFGNQMPTDALTLAGLTRPGVIACGLKMDYQLIKGLSVDITMSVLYPEDEPSESRDWYGYETDMSLSYTFLSRFKLNIEADFLKYGDFFKPPDGEYPDYATRINFSLNAYF